MTRVPVRGTLLILLLVLATLAAGCAPRGGVANAGWTVVTATEDAVYSVLATGTIVAVDAVSGQELWRYPIAVERPGGIGAIFSRPDPDVPVPLQATYGEPVVAEGLLLAASLDGKVHALDRTTGEQAWDYEVEGGIVGGLTVEDGIAYFGTNENTVYALDIATQTLVWTQPFRTEGWVWSAPAVDAERVYIGTMGQRVYALDRDTGEEVWSFQASGALPGAPALTDGAVVIGSVDQHVYALDAATGDLRWAQPVGHWVMGQPLVLDEHVYVASLDGRVHALSVADGAPRWDAVSVERTVRAGPEALDGALVVANQAGELWRVDAATGERARLFPDVGEPGTGLGQEWTMLSSPSVTDGLVVSGTTSGIILALETEAGLAVERWIYNPS